MKINLEQDNIKEGVLGLVVSLIEILQELMDHQALRKMEKGYLSENEIDKLGQSLFQLEETIKTLKTDHQIHDAVENIRSQLDQLVSFENFKIKQLH